MSKNKKTKVETPEVIDVDHKVKEVQEEKKPWWKDREIIIAGLSALGSLAMVSIQLLIHRDEMGQFYTEMMTYKDPTTGVSFELTRTPTPAERVELAKACRNGTTEDTLASLGLI